LKKILIIDIDDVLLDWTKSFDQFIRDKYAYNGIYLGDNSQRLWEVLKIDRTDIDKVMKEHSELDRFKNLNYYKDAEELMNYSHLFNKIISVTSCGTTENIIMKRNFNIRSKFGVHINDIIYLDFLNHKDEAIKKIIKNNQDAEIYMVDDNVDDIKNAILFGVKAYVYKSAFHDSTDLPTINSLKEFFEIIVK